MKIIVLYPKCSSKSAKKLASALKAHVENPFETGRRNYVEYDLVINYGCNLNIIAPFIMNKPISVARCIDKFATFSILKRAGIPVPNFTTEKDVAKHYECVVVRKSINERANKGVEYIYPKEDELPIAPLYTEYFWHKKEFRVVVVNGITISCYEKEAINDKEWVFIEKNYKYLNDIKEACVKASEALGIHYAGYDVVVNNNNEFVILEANSAPIITDDVIKEFKRLCNMEK